MSFEKNFSEKDITDFFTDLFPNPKSASENQKFEDWSNIAFFLTSGSTNLSGLLNNFIEFWHRNKNPEDPEFCYIEHSRFFKDKHRDFLKHLGFSEEAINEFTEKIAGLE